MLVLSGGFLFWFLGWRSYRLLEAVPEQSALVLTFSSVQQLQTLFPRNAGGLASLAVLQSCRADAEQALSLFRADKNLSDRPFAAAFSLHPNDSLHPVFVVDAGHRIDLARFLADLSDSVKVVSSVFKGQILYTVQRPGRDRFVLATARNIVLFSRFSYLVEDVLLQVGDRNRWWQTQANMEEASFRAILRTNVLAERCRGQMAPGWEHLPGLLAANAEAVVAGFDGKQWRVAVRAEQIGVKSTGGQMPRFNMAAVLPDNTALLTWEGTGQPGALAEFAGEDGNQADFKRYVAPWAGKEAAFALLEPYSPGMREDQFWVCAVRDEALAHKRLNEYGERTGLLHRYTYQTFEIRQFLSRALLEPLLPSERQDFQNPVCVLLDGYAVFAASPSALELWIDKYIVGQTLANLPEYLLLNKGLPEQSSRFVYGNTDYWGLLFKQVFGPAFSVGNAADIALPQNSGLYGLDLQQRRADEWSGSLAVRKSSVSAAAASILWKASLSGAAITQPFLIQASGPDSAGAILIQDEQFQLYRLSLGGNVVWRKQLDQPILSSVQGIDFFANGSMCYLFNTADALWVIDDEGREVVGYPLRLQSPATNGVTAVDFNGDHRHSLFVACANGNLYGFDQFGRPLPGWNPKSGVGRVKHPLLHVKKETKDYLAVLSLEGQLSVFDRSGDPHFAPQQFEGNFFVSPPQIDAAAESVRIVCANAAGRAYVCNLSGQTFQLELGGNHKVESSMVLENLFGDERRDYALLNGSALVLSGYTGSTFQKKAVKTFAAPPDTLFAVGQSGRLGMLDRGRRQVFLLNATGDVHSGFPLAGTTPFILDALPAGGRGYVLIVGNGMGVYGYKVSGW
jgi:hypothetical protein